MMTSLETYWHRGQGRIQRWASHRRIQMTLGLMLSFLRGFLLSAGALAHHPMPLGLGLLLQTKGLPALAMTLGSSLGFWVFWGRTGLQGMVWSGLGLVFGWLLGRKPHTLSLLGSAGAFIAAGTGLLFHLLLQDATTIPIYLLRIGVGIGSAVLWSLEQERHLPTARWLASGVTVLALAQVYGLGFFLAGAIAAKPIFPGVVLAGLGLDLAQVTPIPMTVVLSLCWATRLIPRMPRWLGSALPGAVYLTLTRDWKPALGLVLGGVLGGVTTKKPQVLPRPDEAAQLRSRLEQMSGALDLMRQQLLGVPVLPIDESMLTARVRERACGGCPCRKTCLQRLDPVPEELLHRPLFQNITLPIPCKKPSRMILELRRAQEQLRTIRAERDRMAEYRWAVQQQYQCLSHLLHQATAESPSEHPRRFRPEIAVRSAGREHTSGDCCVWFAGTGNLYYILLCDGMGTGLGAAQEGSAAVELLRELLQAGCSPGDALKSINSLLALCGKAGAVTIDLAQLELDTGRAAVYKWGAAPSWIIREGRAEKIGTAGPPPGLSIQDGRETVTRLSLRRGDLLLLVSDGIDGSVVSQLAQSLGDAPGELAARVLAEGCHDIGDDATVAVIRLSPVSLLREKPSKEPVSQDAG